MRGRGNSDIIENLVGAFIKLHGCRDLVGALMKLLGVNICTLE